MSGVSNDIFGLAEQKLSWLEDRQRVLARNVANANTPNYQAQDVQPFSSTLSAVGLTPVHANPMYLPVSTGEQNLVVAHSGERAPDGNQVSVEAEMTKVADTDNQQRLVTNLYSKYMSMFATALGKG